MENDEGSQEAEINSNSEETLRELTLASSAIHDSHANDTKGSKFLPVPYELLSSKRH